MMQKHTRVEILSDNVIWTEACSGVLHCGDYYSLQLRHDIEKKGESEGHNLYMWACLISPADINGRITVHLNAPETDSEGQTLQIIPSPLISYCYAASKVPDRPSRAAQTEMSAAVWLGKTSRRCVTKGGRVTAIFLPQSSSSCPEQGSSVMGNNWHVMEMCFKHYFISKHLQLPSPHILNWVWLTVGNTAKLYLCFQNVTVTKVTVTEVLCDKKIQTSFTYCKCILLLAISVLTALIETSWPDEWPLNFYTTSQQRIKSSKSHPLTLCQNEEKVPSKISFCRRKNWKKPLEASKQKTKIIYYVQLKWLNI